jgi:hypothetical protein
MTDPAPTPPILNYASPGVRMPKTPLSRRTRWTIGVLCGLGVLCVGAFALIPLDREVRDTQNRIIQVSILRPDLVKAIRILLPAGFVALLTSSIIFLARRRPLLGVLLFVAIAFVSFILMVGSIFDQIMVWTVFDQVTASDGHEYYSMNRYFLVGNMMAISRDRPSGWFYKTMDVVGAANGDQRCLSVTLPMPPKPIPCGALYLTPTNLLVVVATGNECYMVYDLANNRFYDDGDLTNLSPNLLIDGQLYAP